MSSEHLLSFIALDDVLAANDCEMQASECQGLICGLYAGGMPNDGKSWKAPVIQQLTDGSVLPNADMQQIDDYVRAIGEVLENDIFSLELIIPEDNAPLEERLTNICRWAQGFLLGYGLQIQSQVIKSDDLNEALNDLMEISQVELEVEESEEMEQALHTVVEHVRVTSQVVFLETRQFIEQAHKESQQTNTRIH